MSPSECEKYYLGNCLLSVIVPKECNKQTLIACHAAL